ncbi:glycosyltransferase [Mycolicibacterium vinylchloridicum]|uniref:glycosyltransferase n=1 Tax=Mycolicibacterium vinylchloridicum TaxID=2736928 RepID=UPI0015CDA706|nr:glycosyltransferase [Mycolicibacterium vinylchloridicum]
MRILIPLVGSRGDVQPGVALGLELERRGHDVIIGAPPNFVDFVAKAGLTARQFGPDVHALYSSPEGQRALAAGSTFKLMSMVSKQMSEYADRMDDELIDISRGAEMIVCTTFSEDRSAIIAESLGIPMVTLHTYPCRKNSHYAPPGSVPANWKVPGVFNRVAWSAIERLRTVVFGKYLNNLRAKLGLPRSWASTESILLARNVPELQMYDQAFVPGLAEEWGSSRPMVGFLWLPQSARAAIGESAEAHTEVLNWVDAGTPPIFFGFGSMPILDFASVLGMIEQICARTGERALVSVGGASLSPEMRNTSENVKVVDALAHDLVFPHCKAAVHHGGIGTLFESLRAGLPTLVCSVSFDQPVWGHQVERLGVGAHIPFTKLRADTLSAGIDAVLDPHMRSRAEALGARLQATGDGVPRVCDIVEKTAAR